MMPDQSLSVPEQLTTGGDNNGEKFISKKDV